MNTRTPTLHAPAFLGLTLAAAFGLLVAGCEVDADSSAFGDTTETGDDETLAELDVNEPLDETDEGDGDGDGDGADGTDSADDTADIAAEAGGDGDGDEGDPEQPSVCGDGIVSADEECDTAMAIPLPCGGDQVGSFLCNADCTKNESFCGCEPGTEGCLCDQLHVCDPGLECINDGLPLCHAPACLVYGQPCGPLDVCCTGTTCQPDPIDTTGQFHCL
jgi:hypothetical protein